MGLRLEKIGFLLLILRESLLCSHRAMLTLIDFLAKNAKQSEFNEQRRE
jgi:hypothetical protein